MLEDQNTSVELFKELRDSNTLEHFKEPMEQVYKSAVEHQKRIRKYGRFPHRNAILGRSSTKKKKSIFHPKRPSLESLRKVNKRPI